MKWAREVVRRWLLSPWEARREAKLDARIRLALEGEPPKEPAGWMLAISARSNEWEP